MREFEVASGTVRRQGKSQITVKFGNKTVTRHLINGVGKHPDDTVPNLHTTLQRAVASRQEDLTKISEVITRANKEIAANGPEANEARNLMPTLIASKALAEVNLKIARERHEKETSDNPLMVYYF